MKKLLYIGAMSALLLTACGEEKAEETDTSQEESDKAKEKEAEQAKKEAEKEAKQKAKEEEKIAKQEAKEEEKKAKAEAKLKEEQEREAEKEEKRKAKEEAKLKEEQASKKNVTQIPVWQSEITKIASNSDIVADKFNTLEKFLITSDVTKGEINQFSNEIVTDYRSGNYLKDAGNHERMLTNIFKAYHVEKNSKGDLKDFAFDYFQNLKYVYRGVETIDSEAVKSNESQMDKALKTIGK